MAGMGQWGEALQGAGAWFSGQGPQYEFLNDERRRKAMITDYARVYSLGQAGQWDTAARLLQNRIGDIQRLGGDPKDTMALYEHIADPAKREAGMAELGAFIQAGILSGDIEAPGGDQSPQQFGATYMGKDQAGNLFQITQARDPNTGNAQTVMSPVGHNSPQQGQLSIVGQMGMTSGEAVGYAGDRAAAQQAAQYQYAAPIAGAQAQARANVEAATAPKIAADTTAAQEKAKADVGRDTQSRITERSGRALNAAADLVMAAFEDVNTGPVWGRVPAAMRDATAYQTAEGAAGQYRAQMRKIIRPPGSGPWTDLDEQKLDQIVPNLQDTREAVAAKIAQGRALYDAQVGGAQGNASNAPRETPRRRSTDQQAPAAIKFLGFE